MSPRRSRAALGHAVRVAGVTTGLIAVLYVLVSAVLDIVVVGRLTHQVDERLTGVLRDTGRGLTPLSEGIHAGVPDRGRDLDDAPVLLWRVSTSGAATPLTAAAPQLPRRTWAPGTPVSASLGGSEFRLEAAAGPGGWLVAAESLAERNHVRDVLLVAEAVVAPVILLAIYLGSLTVGLKAAAPVERTRRRQLEFTADASHELRTPLSVIEAEVGLALSSPRDADYYRSSLERVGGESHRLRRIVEDLLWLARFDSEPPPPGDEPVSLASIAAACIDRFGAVAATRGLTLVLREEGAVPALIKAPPEWVDRLLGVLVDNACRYSPAEGRVTVTVGTSGPRAHVSVEDEGPGIPDEDRERLFDRFHRASDQPGGAGLGLAIADAVVRSTGGRWRIGAAAGGGAHMEVSWHRAGAPERRRPAPGTPAPDRPAPDRPVPDRPVPERSAPDVEPGGGQVGAHPAEDQGARERADAHAGHQGAPPGVGAP